MLANCAPSEYLILMAIPRQQWLRERVAILTYMYIVFII